MVREDVGFAEAKRVRAEYQARRVARISAEHEAVRYDDIAGIVWTVLRNEPMRVLLTVLGMQLALALMVVPAVRLPRYMPATL